MPHETYMAFETIYLLREVAKGAVQNKIYIPTESLKEVIKRLLDEDNVVIYSVTKLDEELRVLQKLSFLTIDVDVVVIDREAFLNMTSFVERQEELLRDDKYAMAILEKIRQKAQHVKLLQPQ
jgi:hypothetical protein